MSRDVTVIVLSMSMDGTTSVNRLITKYCDLLNNVCVNMTDSVMTPTQSLSMFFRQRLTDRQTDRTHERTNERTNDN